MAPEMDFWQKEQNASTPGSRQPNLTRPVGSCVRLCADEKKYIRPFKFESTEFLKLSITHSILSISQFSLDTRPGLAIIDFSTIGPNTQTV